MTVILMRHVEYADGPDWRPYLTDKGKKQVDSIGAQLIRSGLVPDRMLHSPRGQTVETANHLAQVFRKASNGKDVPLEPRDWLAEGARIGEEFPPDETVSLVTHKENFNTLVYELGAKREQVPEADHGVAMIFRENEGPRKAIEYIKPEPGS